MNPLEQHPVFLAARTEEARAVLRSQPDWWRTSGVWERATPPREPKAELKKEHSPS